MKTIVKSHYWLIQSAALILFTAFISILSPVFGQRAAITSNTATSRNLFVQWNGGDPERIDVIKWNSAGLNGTEPNLTNSGTSGSAPCFNGDMEYFGNSWAPPDPPSGKVLVGAGTVGVRVPGPDNKVIINSVSANCQPSSAGVSVNTIYKFWQGGQALNKMRVTRNFSFESSFGTAFRPFIPRLYPISDYSQVLHPNADGTMLLNRQVGGFSFCPFGCVITDWNGNDEATSWFAIHNPASGQGMIVRRSPSNLTAVLWIDWDGASFTNSSSVLLQPPTGGFTGELVERQTLCFYDANTWSPSPTLPLGCGN